ncbi:hypothetical protein CL176_03205 [Suicoccus acidiformans]|uniref:Uncharacterized protein n=1 Tax=Suicoccus acidiformans TaxID=2036206 RepID=A0A347WJ58_9LACT|nr:hypothetical protein [Suicoccus acidiformans]AXY25115.1 hypothetical protein CL176_03205 [Suicoccus acidiformans]
MSRYDGPAFNRKARRKHFEPTDSYQPAFRKDKKPKTNLERMSRQTSRSDLRMSQQTPPTRYEVPFLKQEKQVKAELVESTSEQRSHSQGDNAKGLSKYQSESTSMQGQSGYKHPELLKEEAKSEPQKVSEGDTPQILKHSLRILAKRMVKYKDDFILFDK